MVNSYLRSNGHQNTQVGPRTHTTLASLGSTSLASLGSTSGRA